MERIRLEHVINLTVSEDSTVSAISAEGLELMRTIDDKLDRVSLLLSMTNDNRIDENFKLELFYGLLFDLEGLTIVKENGQIIAPTPELKITVPIPRGSIEFLVKVRGDVLTQAPDISFFCHRKAECRYSVREIICFLLHELRNLPPEETLMTVFRMKSYSSVINNLLYRGKGLSDLFATTILDSDYNELIRKIESRGGMCVHERQEKQINGNRCIVSRYVRILKIQFENSQDYFFCPIYYEIVLDNLMPPAVSHQQYELERLKFKLSAGAQNLIQQKGFTIHQCSR